ncbi:MAG: hypothetical protein KME23_12665 [Goleter apudmare HA4340-LM2]|nr:hypothetical protein [Goleter apudmare HA4340-LM2]
MKTEFTRLGEGVRSPLFNRRYVRQLFMIFVLTFEHNHPHRYASTA